jgi:hypothetical protein
MGLGEARSCTPTTVSLNTFHAQRGGRFSLSLLFFFILVGLLLGSKLVAKVSRKKHP